MGRKSIFFIFWKIMDSHVEISSTRNVLAKRIPHVMLEHLSPEIFFSNFRQLSKPVIIRGAASHWPICDRQTLAAFEDKEVQVLRANDNVHFLRQELCESFVSCSAAVVESIFCEPETESTRRYCCRMYLPEQPHMSDMLDFHPLQEFSSYPQRYDEVASIKDKNIGFWMSSAGSVTPLHFDICHGFLAQVQGSKTFIMARPEDTPFMYWRVNRAKCKISAAILDSNSLNGTTSTADFSAWLESRDCDCENPMCSCGRGCKLFSEVAWFIAELEAGGSSRFCAFLY